MMNKKGLSAIVATVLIVLLTISAIIILWSSIRPMISKIEESTLSSPTLTIENSAGYTYWDEDSETFCLNYKRGILSTKEKNLVGVQVIFSFSGDSFTKEIEEGDLPKPGNTRSVCFDLTDYGKPERVSIAPITSSGKNKIVEEITSSIESFEIKKGICSTDCEDKETLDIGNDGGTGGESEETCGNSVCDIAESCSTCSTDCGVCPTVCGNNLLETGETCEPPNTLTCDSSCQIIVSELEYGGYTSPTLESINAEIDISSTYGVAPYTIHVSGSPTTAVGEVRAYENLEYSWDFGESGEILIENPVTNNLVDVGVSQQGPEAAYVYQTPGTYTITLTVRGWTGSEYIVDTTTTDVTISPWSGETRYFDPADGNDVNDGLTENTPWKSGTYLKDWITGGNNRRALIKRGTTLELGQTIYLTGLDKQIGAYGAGSNPIIKASDSWASYSSLINFYGNGNEVGNMVVSDVDFDNNLGKADTAISMYSKTETVYSPMAAGNVHDISILNSHINIDNAGNPVVYTGDGPKTRLSFWNVFFDHGTAIGRQGLYMGSAEYVAVMGGRFVGGDGHRILDHHIYPGGIDHSLYRLIDFDAPIMKNFCINTNSGTPTTKYVLISEIDCDGASNGIDWSNGNNNHGTYFDEVILQKSAIHDLGLNGQGIGVMGYSVERITVRDNIFYNNPQGDIRIDDPLANVLEYRNSFS